MSATTTLKMILLGDAKGAVKALGDVSGNAKKSTKSMSALHTVGKTAGLALAGGFTLAGAAAVQMTKKAADDEQAASRLARTLHSAAGATDAQVASTEDWITAQGKAFGVADDDLRPALSKLAVATGSVSKAQKLASLAMDVSAGSGKSLESVSFALAKAQNGNVSGLARLGVQTTKTTKDTAAYEKAQTASKSAALAYTAAVKAHGKNSIEASIAQDKFTQANKAAEAAFGKTKKTTLGLDEITKNLASTYGGAAAKNADTAAGKQKIMAVQMQELQEQIGSALIPALQRLTTIGLSMIGWVSHNTTTAGLLVAGLAALAAVTWTVSAAIKAWTAITKVAAAAQVIWTNAQWAFNIAMEANPIGVVVVAIIALVAVFVLAYQKVGWFHAGVNAAFRGIMTVVNAAVGFIKAHWGPMVAILGGPIGLAAVLIIKNFDKIQAGIRVLGHWATWLWNNAFAPALRFIVSGIGFMVGIWGKMLSALGHVPGFGWAKAAGEALQNAANKAQDLADHINKIPTSKTSTVYFNVVTHHGTGGHVVGATGGIVTRPTMALIGEAGPEAVVPLNRTPGSSPIGRGFGGGGDTYNVYVSGLVPADEQAVIRKIISGIQKAKTQSFGGRSLGLA